MRQTLEQHETSLRRFTKNLWLVTSIYLLIIGTSLSSIFEKRSQWPFLLKFSLPPGVPIWHLVWGNIFTFVGFSFLLATTWRHFYSLRRDLLLAEQMALQKAVKPPEGVWPPPPAAE